MGMEEVGLVIIGGGPAGLAAAVKAYDQGIRSILILERDREPGGILNQCIHNGFGLHTFREELTGPEYADRFIRMVRERGIELRLDTMVMEMTKDRVVTAMSRERGLFQVRAGAIILAMGCRERPRGALNIPGYRPAGIYTAGTAQRLVNMEGCLPGREVVILGSGDIGLIMARRMTLEGAHVQVVAEIMPYSGGLKRNIVQCLHDFGIPLLLQTTVAEIHGKERVEGVTLAKVDGHGRVIPGTEKRYDCDTLLLSVGLIPENDLSRQMGVEISPVTKGPVVSESLETNLDGVFACGNVLHVHDLVDDVSEEAGIAGRKAAEYLKKERKDENTVPIPLLAKGGVRYSVPSFIRPERMDDALTVRFRVDGIYRDRSVSVYLGEQRTTHRKVRIVAPGEMEQVLLRKKDIEALSPKSITICLEET